jgi:hypothetical protein
MPRVILTDDPKANAWQFDQREDTLTVSRPKAREVIGSEASDQVIERLGLAEWEDARGLAG